MPKTVDFERDLRAIHTAASNAGLEIVTTRPVWTGRTGVYATHAVNTAGSSNYPIGRFVTAAKVSRQTDSIAPIHVQQRIVYRLSALAAPVPAPLTESPEVTEDGVVGFWQWADKASVTPREWGRATGEFHRAGLEVEISGIEYDPGRVFVHRIEQAYRLTEDPAHPLFRRASLVDAFVEALKVAVEDARLAAKRGRIVLAHGDNYPGNLMRVEGRCVMNDFERITHCHPGLDLAGAIIGIGHYGLPKSVARIWRSGYGPDAPTIEEGRPFARIRELSGAIVSMLLAGQDVENAREMEVRTQAITQPGKGEQWTFTGNPDGMFLYGMTRVTSR